VKFLLWVAGLVALVWLVSVFIVQQFSIASNSMETLLQVNDRVVVNHTAYWFTPIARGDVVVFNGRDSFSLEDKDYVKRVIGLPGDRVMCCDPQGRLVVNGDSLNEDRYIFPGDSPSELEFDIQVPEGKYWLMGDRRAASSDSRSHLGDPGGGFVSASAVKGQVVAVMWPLSRLQLLSQ
jgi:signal peptidase I